MQPTFSELRHRIAEAARSAAAGAADRGNVVLDGKQLDLIAEGAAAIVVQELDERFVKRLHTFETRQNDTAFRVGQLNDNFREHVEATARNVDAAAKRLVGLHRALIRLDFGRDAKFVLLELLPTTALFLLATYHFAALDHPRWATLFDTIGS